MFANWRIAAIPDNVTRVAEVVTGDGQRVSRERISLENTGPFGSRQLRVPLQLAGHQWARLEVWDVAANGAFTQPVWIEE